MLQKFLLVTNTTVVGYFFFLLIIHGNVVHSLTHLLDLVMLFMALPDPYPTSQHHNSSELMGLVDTEVVN